MLLYYFFQVPIFLTTGFAYYPDSISRLTPNEPFVGVYYFFWTTLLYLPTFFFLIALISLLIIYPFLNFSILICSGLLLLAYPIELGDYVTSNLTCSNFIYHSCGSNILLTNLLNKYHPFIFYISAIWLISIAFKLYLLPIPKRNFSESLNAAVPQVQLWGVLLTNLLALWMGSWWALQEGTWGGWWNWDSSETFGLLVTLIVLILAHSTFNLFSQIYLVTKIKLLVYTLICSYFFIQLGFDLVSHNFGSKFFFFFNNNLFFLELLTFFFYSFFRIFRNIKTFNIIWKFYSLIQVYRGTSSFNSYTHLVRLSVGLLISYWIVWSYKPLLNYFFWNFSQLNLVNFENSLQLVNTMLVVAGFIWLSRFQSITIPILVSNLVNIVNWKFTLLLFTQIKSFKILLHFIIFFISLINIFLHDITTYTPTFTKEFVDTLVFNNIPRVGYTVSILDNWWVEEVQIWISASYTSTIGWNIYSFTNIPMLNFFSLFFTNDLIYNFYALGENYLRVELLIQLPYLGLVNIFFFFLLLLTWKVIY